MPYASFDRVLPHCSSMASCVEGDSPLALRRTTYVSVDASSPRMHCTAMIVHPEFPQGAAHWLHPCEHLRAFSDVKIPGLPFTLRVPQRQGVGGDDTGCAVWRGATVLGRRLLLRRVEGKAEGDAGRRGGRRPVAVELGCGAGAITAAVASALGCDSWGTDMPGIAMDAEKAAAAHARAAARAGHALRGALRVAPLMWGEEEAAAFAAAHLPATRADVVLGSEVVYALNKTSLETAIAVLEKLAATIRATQGGFPFSTSSLERS